MAMRTSPFVREVTATHGAFLWDYSRRYKNALEGNKLDDAFLRSEQRHLEWYRRGKAVQGNLEAAQRNPQAAQGNLQAAQGKLPQVDGGRIDGPSRNAHQGRRPIHMDSALDDATASMKDLKFGDIEMDADDAHPQPVPNPPIPDHRMFVELASRPPPQPPKAGPSKPRTKQEPAADGVPKRKRDAADEGEKKTKRVRKIYPPKETPNEVPCKRCAAGKKPCFDQDIPDDGHYKGPIACVECAKIKQKCDFPEFAHAAKDKEVVVKVKTIRKNPAKKVKDEPKTSAKPKSKRATKPKKSPSVVPSSGEEDLPRPGAAKGKSRAVSPPSKAAAPKAAPKSAAPKAAPKSAAPLLDPATGQPRQSTARPLSKSKHRPLSELRVPAHPLSDPNVRQPAPTQFATLPQAPRAPERIVVPLAAEERAALQAVAAAEEHLQHIRRMARERAALQFQDVMVGRTPTVERAEAANEEDPQAGAAQQRADEDAMDGEMQKELELLDRTNRHHTMRAIEQWQDRKWVPPQSCT